MVKGIALYTLIFTFFFRTRDRESAEAVYLVGVIQWRPHDDRKSPGGMTEEWVILSQWRRSVPKVNSCTAQPDSSFHSERYVLGIPFRRGRVQYVSSGVHLFLPCVSVDLRFQPAEMTKNKLPCRDEDWSAFGLDLMLNGI